MSAIRAKEQLKAKRKLKRKQLLLHKQEPDLSVYFTSDATEHLFVANGGMQNGVSRELLTTLCDGLVQTITMLEERDYCFLTCNDVPTSLALTDKLNGISVQGECERRNITYMLAPAVAAGLPLRLYVGFMTRIPDKVGRQYCTPVPLPPGLIMKSEYITCKEEQTLLAFFRFRDDTRAAESRDAILQTCSSAPAAVTQDCIITDATISCPGEPYVPPEAHLKLRRVKHYGYDFMYNSNNVDMTKPLPGGLPELCGPLLRRVTDDGLVPTIPDQLTVNEYLPGAGTPTHTHAHTQHTQTESESTHTQTESESVKPLLSVVDY